MRTFHITITGPKDKPLL